MRGVAAWVAVLAGATMVGATPTSAPDLRVRARTDGVVVHWTYRGDVAGPGSRLEIERATASAAFASVGTVSAPKRRAAWTDDVTKAGTYTYRARIVTSATTTAWSDPASITIADTGGGSVDSGPPGDPPLPAGQRECPAGSTAGVLQLVNAFRHSLGLAPFVDNALLDRAARTHTIAMVQSQNLTHTGWVDYIRAAGYTGGFLAENIAYGYQSADAVVKGWLASSGHYANIVNGYRDSGVGCVMDARGRLWWTQDFGR